MVVTPALLASAWYALRKRVLPRLFGFDHPTRTAWDWLFGRKKYLWLWLYLKQKDSGGNPICKSGFFGRESYVSTYPYDEGIYLEAVYATDEKGMILRDFDENGNEIPQTKGMLVRGDEIERIEVYRIPNAMIYRWYNLKRILKFHSRIGRIILTRIRNIRRTKETTHGKVDSDHHSS